MKNIEVLKINQFNKGAFKEEFYVNTIKNHLTAGHLHIEKPHKHNFYAAMLFTKGNGMHEIDFQHYEVKPGSVFLLSPGQTHHWELSNDAEGYIFFHSQEFYDMNYVHDRLREFSFFSSIHNSRCIYLSQDEHDKVKTLFNNILQEFRSAGWKKQQIILSFIMQLYITFNRIMMTGSNKQETLQSRYHIKFQDFEKLLEEHFYNEKLPSKYAEMMNITPKHLNRITKTIINKTTSDVIAERVILEAKRLLLYSNSSFSEIAFTLGYNDYPYFSRVFKKYTGETPSIFLKRYSLI